MRSATSITTVSTILIFIISPIVLAQSGTEEHFSRGLGCWPELPPQEFSEEFRNEAIEMTSGDAEIQVNGDASFKGPIEMLSQARSLKASSATYDSEKEIFSVEGNVEYRDQTNLVKGESAHYNTLNGQFDFNNSKFELAEIPARGSADKIEIKEAGIVELTKVRYTSCPDGNNDWFLSAKSIEIDTNTGMGTAKSASLSFKGVPFFYWPYFSYPVTDDRKSGLLFPKLGSSDRRGFEFTQPIYWNISPGQDATFVPHFMADRGLQLGTEYRFLTHSNEGVLWGDYLADDDETGKNRWQYNVKTISMLPWEWRASITAQGVSDDNYFEDMSSSINQTSQTNLNRQAALEYYDSVWSVFMRVQDFQTIDPLITTDEEPYTQVPQFVANGMWRNGLLGMDYGFDSETTYFMREDSVKGLRTHIQPKISLPLGNHGLYLIPEAAFDYTAYNLKDQPIGDTSTPDRAAPILNINSGAIFERSLGTKKRRAITIEPRVQYTYIPKRNQDDIPVFDTITPDFNLVQLFRKNRFIGYDRLGDTNQISIGLTSRILDNRTGQELLTATIGQTRFFEDAEVTLPGELPSDISESNYIAELGVNVWGAWKADIRYQLDADANETVRSSIRFQYNPGHMKALNIGYRYDRDTLEQTDFSFSWPLGEKWSTIGRYNYSIEESEVLDEYLGLEYSSCCWAIQVVGRKSVARSTGEQDKSISFQFILKGFSGFGGGATSGLQRDILGYSKY
ncbi:MAG: LPS assembly protein LptD [Gammaproteobacteria bacterium]|nr:LPS assembly protein LptD [Gammaproteobacteria bacterium]MCP4089570.1 LPS assembly protein LptD [Gammaproteobacteria bacterium]MCP4278095.1 LPS assembly protein LptD [Gammaproteobacteria bacterium]MCP4832461.1 LPS assembly protein LptD [Gammaproteobacteria bacterium]MCP4930153.1 LPS assembly protein LptD [Gammaproteobacteria bacterium]